MKKLCLVILVIMAAACSHNSSIDKKPASTRPPEVVVHRGANRLAPENTLAALKLAIDQGATYIEIDLASSSDKVLYCFNGKILDKTTNGKGVFAEQKSEYIDKLDAGSWFSEDYKGEPVPRVSEIIKMAKGKTKFYFDVKSASIEQLLELIHSEKLENDCFVWFEDMAKAKEFREKDKDLALKMNANSPAEVDSFVKEFHPQIIESNIVDINPEMQAVCKKNNIKLMANLLRDSWWEYKQAIEIGVDMVNIDHPDYFHDILKDQKHHFTAYRLAAHRGGILEGHFGEFDPQSLKAAIDSGYWMIEISVQPTADKQILFHHDKNLKRVYGIDKDVSEMTLSELKKLKALKGGYSPMTFEEVAQMFAGKTRFLINNVKEDKCEPWFYKELNRILTKYNMLKNAYFINDVRSEFDNGKFGFRMDRVEEMKKRLEDNEDIAAHYFFFAHGNNITSEVVRWCEKHHIDVCASVNIDHYKKLENHAKGAERDIKFLKNSGVTLFQIDSEYDSYFDLASLKK